MGDTVRRGMIRKRQRSRRGNRRERLQREFKYTGGNIKGEEMDAIDSGVNEGEGEDVGGRRNFWAGKI